MKAAVLTVGSLYWEDTKPRQAWRQSRLEQDERVRVAVPIRYGRCSRSRGDTYTMTFSQLCERPDYGFGAAWLIPCRRSVRSEAELIREAEWLWAAERNRPQSDGSLSAGWGAVAVLVNPDAAASPELLQAWTSAVEGRAGYGQLSHAASEQAVVDERGLLGTSWPRVIESGEPAGADVILATATNPTLSNGRYPTARTVVRAWLRDPQDHVRYFLRNRECGIATFQDQMIARQLLRKKEWPHERTTLLEEAADGPRSVL